MMCDSTIYPSGARNNRPHESYPSSRHEAIELGERFYFTGKLCRKGHLSKRTLRGVCHDCKRLYRKKYRQSSVARKLNNEYRQKRRKERRTTDLNFKINEIVRKCIGRELQGRKNGISWKEFVLWTIEELREHLEKQFRDDICWDNYGSHWNIDHIKPISKCSSFEEAWALSNLQPLESFINQQIKSNNYPFDIEPYLQEMREAKLLGREPDYEKVKSNLLEVNACC